MGEGDFETERRDPRNVHLSNIVSGYVLDLTIDDPVMESLTEAERLEVERLAARFTRALTSCIKNKPKFNQTGVGLPDALSLMAQSLRSSEQPLADLAKIGHAKMQ